MSPLPMHPAPVVNDGLAVVDTGAHVLLYLLIAAALLWLILRGDED